MIVWLAYYPISGAAVCHLIEECFGTPVHHRLNPSFPAPGGGQQDWQRFYRQSSAADEIVFIRTQIPPDDGNPAIYVVRDGRESILAYCDYLNAKDPGSKTVIELVLGFSASGDWSSHYRSWSPAERAATLPLKYESVLQYPDRALQEITAFTGIRRPCLPWRGALDKLSEDDPRFKCEGPHRWLPTQKWNPYVEAVFWRCHGTLMTELGYSPLDPTSDYCPATDGFERFIDQSQEQILRLATQIAALETERSSLNRQIRTLRITNVERTETIHQLSAEFAQLRRARAAPRQSGKE